MPSADANHESSDKTGRGFLPWIFVVPAMLVGFYVTAWLSVACGSENQTEEMAEFCETEWGALGYAGSVVALASAFIARALRREWPWLWGVALALAMSGLVWLVAP